MNLLVDDDEDSDELVNTPIIPPQLPLELVRSFAQFDDPEMIALFNSSPVKVNTTPSKKNSNFLLFERQFTR